MPFWYTNELNLTMKVDDVGPLTCVTTPEPNSGDPVLVEDLIEYHFYVFGGVARARVSDYQNLDF